MKKIKYSVVEKKLIRNVFISVLIQVLIIVSFVRLFNASQPIDINDTAQTEITVDDIYTIRVLRENLLFVVADSTYYLFTSRATFKDFSVHELYNSISEGDHLSLIYYESDSILFKKVNTVVDARTKTETYRSFEEYKKSKQGLDIAVIIVFSVIEVLFCVVAVLFFAFNKNTRKSICRKIKKAIK